MTSVDLDELRRCAEVTAAQPETEAEDVLARGVLRILDATVTPTGAEHLLELFYEARTSALDYSNGRTWEALAADEAAVEAFNTALREYTR